jgi:hypothetical protein
MEELQKRSGNNPAIRELVSSGNQSLPGLWKDRMKNAELSQKST